MLESKREKLEAAGFRVGTADEFLGLTEAESEIVEIRLALSRALRETRGRAELSQVALAERVHSSQSRIAKAEAGDPAISVGLLLRALLAAGASRQDIGLIIAGDAIQEVRLVGGLTINFSGASLEPSVPPDTEVRDRDLTAA